MRRAISAADIAAGALALIYLAGSFFFAGHYLWRTEIDGTDVSFRSRERVREECLNPEIYYELVITGRDEMEDVLTPAELGMSYVFDDTLDRFSAQMSGWAWPMPVEISGEIDEFTQMLWNSLNEENKVSLFVRFIDIESGTWESRIVNKNK